MNLKPVFFILALFLGVVHAASAQDTLPKFSLRNVGGNRIIIGWVNPFTDINQISIQRSFDSLKNYKTILSVADPKAVQNGFADTKAPSDHMFYRIFYVLEGSRFFFTAAKTPVLDTAVKRDIPIVSGNLGTIPAKTDSSKAVTPVIKKPEFVPSFYVYTNRDGYVFINLPDADSKKYSIKFFDADDNFLFELKNVKETALTLDKANFFHAGWFKFELYNDEKLVEKNKFYLAKVF